MLVYAMKHMWTVPQREVTRVSVCNETHGGGGGRGEGVSNGRVTLLRGG